MSSLFCRPLKRRRDFFPRKAIQRSAHTSLDQVASLVHKIRGQIVIAEELLETEGMQDFAAPLEICSDAQYADEHWEVDVETVRDDRDHIHVTHDLRVRRLDSVVLRGNVLVQMNHAEEVQAERRRQPTEHPAKPDVVREQANM